MSLIDWIIISDRLCNYLLAISQFQLHILNFVLEILTELLTPPQLS